MNQKAKFKRQSATFRTPEGWNLVVSLEEIGPAEAERMLATNKRNRRVNRRSVAIFRRDMERGEWRLTEQGLAFSAAGDLLNGQHRLKAIRESGVALPMLVFRGLPEASQEAIDTGMARSVAETMTMIDGEANATRIVALARLIGRCGFSTRLRLSLTQVRGLVRALPLLKDLAAADVKRVLPGCRAPVFLAPIGWALHLPRKQSMRVLEFADAFMKGLGLTPTHPAGILRHYALGQTGDLGAHDGSMQLRFGYAADCLHAWLTTGEMTSAKATRKGVPWLKAQMPELTEKLEECFQEARNSTLSGEVAR